VSESARIHSRQVSYMFRKCISYEQYLFGSVSVLTGTFLDRYVAW
jgi:hypothetical protein